MGYEGEFVLLVGFVWLGEEIGPAYVVGVRMRVDEPADWGGGEVSYGPLEFVAECGGCVDEDYARGGD